MGCFSVSIVLEKDNETLLAAYSQICWAGLTFTKICQLLFKLVENAGLPQENSYIIPFFAYIIPQHVKCFLT